MRACEAPLFLNKQKALDWIHHATERDEDFILVQHHATPEYKAFVKPRAGDVPENIYEFFNPMEWASFQRSSANLKEEAVRTRVSSLIAVYSLDDD